MRIFALLLLLALPLSARTPAKPAPVPMAKQRTVEEDKQLRIWITDIMVTAQSDVKRADEAEANEAGLRGKLDFAQTEHAKTLTQLDVVDKENAELKKQLSEEHKAKLNAEKKEKAEHAHVSKIKNWLSIALGIAFVMAVQYLPWSIVIPPWNIYGRVILSGGAYFLAWVIVARFV